MRQTQQRFTDHRQLHRHDNRFLKNRKLQNLRPIKKDQHFVKKQCDKTIVRKSYDNRKNKAPCLEVYSQKCWGRRQNSSKEIRLLTNSQKSKGERREKNIRGNTITDSGTYQYRTIISRTQET